MWEWKQPALVWAVKSRAECRAQGPASLPGFEGAALLPAERTEAAGLDRKAAGAPPLTPFSGQNQLNFQVESRHLHPLQAATGEETVGRQTQMLRDPVETNLKRVGAFESPRCD